MAASRSPMANLNGAIVLFALWLAAAQVVAVLIPESGLPRIVFAVFLLILLINTAAAAPDRIRLLRSLAVTFGALFLLKFVVLRELSATGTSGLKRVLQALLEGITLGALLQPPSHPATSYLALLSLVLFLVAVFFLPARGVERSGALDPAAHRQLGSNDTTEPGVLLASHDLMQQVLSPDLQDQLAQGRQLLAELRDALTRVRRGRRGPAALAASMRQLDELFLLVIVGEFNAGKSAFINALLGQPVLQEGVTPTTAQIHVAEVRRRTAQRQSMRTACMVVTAPVELLRDMHIVDTPGTNAIIREHERLTTDFVPRVRPRPVRHLRRSAVHRDRAALPRPPIRDWGKKIVIVVNKIDIFEPRVGGSTRC